MDNFLAFAQIDYRLLLFPYRFWVILASLNRLWSGHVLKQCGKESNSAQGLFFTFDPFYEVGKPIKVSVTDSVVKDPESIHVICLQNRNPFKLIKCLPYLELLLKFI